MFAASPVENISADTEILVVKLKRKFMKKKRLDAFLFRDCIQKTIRVMKLVSFFLLVGFIQVSANIYSQTANIKISMQEVALSDVIKEIQKQTEFTFFYSPKDVEGVVVEKVELEKASLEKVLDLCLMGTKLEYEIVYKAVILRNEKEKEQPAPLPVEQPQKKNIKGKVLDIKGQPIPGTTVMVKGATIGTITDFEGQYNLDVPSDAKSLLFSFVGFITKEELIGTQTYIPIVLTEDVQGLEEIVVVGYGQQKKVAVTGAVSTVQTKELVQSSSASLANALSGKLTGLSSLQSGGGQPGRDDATMYLRGAATLNGTNPLILIDGVPRDNIRTIDANEVASVSILKDASATAVFGVRGANGVIMITTKRGAPGKAELTMTAEQSYTSFTREPERLHSVEYMKLRNEASLNDGLSAPYSEATMAKYANPLAGLDPKDPDYTSKAALLQYMYPDHDYYREYISRYAPQTRINMGVTGGTDKVTYFVNAAYLNQGGNLNTEPKSVLGYDPSAKMDRYNFRSNLDYKISESLSAYLNLGSYIEQVNMPAAWLYGGDTGWMMSDLLYQAQTILPITPGPTTIDGFGVSPGQIVDPGYMDRSAFEIMNRFGYRNEVRSNLNATYGMNWDLGKIITPGLSIKGMISYDSKATTVLEGSKQERLYLAEINTNTDQFSYAVKRPDERLLSISKSANSRYNINMQASVNYTRKFGKHEVGGMFLAQRDYWETTGGEIPYNVLGVASRATYNYDSRYFGELDMGYNGSEQFAPSKRFGFFPAVSGGWVISSESFLKDNKTITNLKLRASYGKVGNDKLGNLRFLYLDNIQMGGGPLGSLGLGQGIDQGLLGNPNISWEVANKKNIGVDFQLFSDLTGSFDYFKENREDILINRGTVPSFQGVPLSNIPKVNMGKVENQGYEIELSYNKEIAKDFTVGFKGNYSYNHNIVKYADESINDETFVHRYRQTGYSIGQAWGYKIDWQSNGGYWISKDEIESSGLKYGMGGDPRVGGFKYVDLNNDGTVDDKDLSPIGYSYIPRVNYGLTVNLQYKAFDFTIFFQGVSKYSSAYGSQGVYEYIIRGTYFDYHKAAWTPERFANGEKITYPALSTQSNSNHVANDFFIMDRSFTRLKNIELGYTLPESGLKTLGINKLRIYVSGQNLFTWDHLRMGHLDPENDNPIGYPVTRMMNIGANITF